MKFQNSKPHHRVVLFAALILLPASSSFSQSPPVDLTELSLEELLGVRLINRGEDSREESQQIGRNTKIGYRYYHVKFEDYIDGTDSRSAEDVLADYPVVPNSIDQEAHVLSVSQRINDDLAFQCEVPFLRQGTDHIRRNGDPFRIETSGLGDILALGIYRVRDRTSHQCFVMAGLSLPTGSIDETGDTPRGKNTPVPYTMQLGSGTYDLQPGVLYIGREETLEWGTELTAKIRLGRNDKNYSLGDRATLTTWLKKQTLPWLEPNIKGTLTVWDRIDGHDDDLDPSLAPVADPDLFGGTRALISAGAHLTCGSSAARPWTLGIEFGLPIYQSLNGPQPGQDWAMNASITKGF